VLLWMYVLTGYGADVSFCNGHFSAIDRYDPPTDGARDAAMARWLVQIFGAALVVSALTDVFLTVLYARSGIGVISHRISRWNWRLFRLAAAPFPRKVRDGILTFGGPALLVWMALAWVLSVLVGFACVIWPALGRSVQASQGETPTDFVSALYYTGYWMTSVGNGDLRPLTPFYKVVSVMSSFLGLSIITLMLTYFVQVFTALQRRNTFALSLHDSTGGTGDAVDLLCGLGAAGDFDDARAHIAKLANELADLHESHHFYESLFYFTFREPHYAIARVAVIVMECGTLVRSALDEGEYAALKHSAAMTQFWASGVRLLDELARVFVPGGPPREKSQPPDPQSAERWRRRFRRASARLREAGIRTTPDEAAAAELYVKLRREWDPYIKPLAMYMGHDPADIDPAAALHDDPFAADVPT